MSETTALGAAMAAGAAEGVNMWDIEDITCEDMTCVTSEKYQPQIKPEGESCQDHYFSSHMRHLHDFKKKNSRM